MNKNTTNTITTATQSAQNTNAAIIVQGAEQPHRAAFKLKRGIWDRALPVWYDWSTEGKTLTDEQSAYWFNGVFLLVSWLMGWCTDKEFVQQVNNMVADRQHWRKQGFWAKRAEALAQRGSREI